MASPKIPFFLYLAMVAVLTWSNFAKESSPLTYFRDGSSDLWVESLAMIKTARCQAVTWVDGNSAIFSILLLL